jgi:hypothetical protein
MAGPSGPDLFDVCDYQHPNNYRIFPADVIPDGGYFRNAQNIRVLNILGDPCTTYCVDAGYTTCFSPIHENDMGGWTVQCHYTACKGVGRRPEGLAEAAPQHGCTTGRYLADMAHLEAASVHAFRVLVRELVAHGAPRALIARARRAARDEIRHARITRALAAAHGSAPAPVAVAATRLRSLEEIALENASEGCVRETYGALVASWQAHTAADAGVRAAMRDIAIDETQHAELAWDVDAWLKTRLDRAARVRVADAKRRAARTLAAEAAQPVPAELVHALGLPDAGRARAFVAAATDELWS